MKLKVYEMAFENEVGEYLDISLYPEEGWLSFSTDGKKEGFSVSSEKEWDEIDKKIREFFANDEEDKYYLLGSKRGDYATGCTSDKDDVSDDYRFIEITEEDFHKLTDGVNYPEYEGQAGVNKMYEKYKDK